MLQAAAGDWAHTGRVLPRSPDRPAPEAIARALELDGVYVQTALGDQVGTRRETRIEDAVAATAYPVKVAVLRPGPSQRDAGAVLTRLHQVALRDLTVDPAVYLGVDLAAGSLTAREFDITTPAGQAIAVAADRAHGDVGRQLVIATTLLADSRAEQAYDRLLDEAEGSVQSTPAQPPADPAAQPAPSGVDLPAVLITLAVLLVALVSMVWSRRRAGR